MRVVNSGSIVFAITAGTVIAANDVETGTNNVKEAENSLMSLVSSWISVLAGSRPSTTAEEVQEYHSATFSSPNSKLVAVYHAVPPVLSTAPPVTVTDVKTATVSGLPETTVIRTKSISRDNTPKVNTVTTTVGSVSSDAPVTTTSSYVPESTSSSMSSESSTIAVEQSTSVSSSSPSNSPSPTSQFEHESEPESDSEPEDITLEYNPLTAMVLAKREAQMPSVTPLDYEANSINLRPKVIPHKALASAIGNITTLDPGVATSTYTQTITTTLSNGDPCTFAIAGSLGAQVTTTVSGEVMTCTVQPAIVTAKPTMPITQKTVAELSNGEPCTCNVVGTVGQVVTVPCSTEHFTYTVAEPKIHSSRTIETLKNGLICTCDLMGTVGQVVTTTCSNTVLTYTLEAESIAAASPTHFDPGTIVSYSNKTSPTRNATRASVGGGVSTSGLFGNASASRSLSNGSNSDVEAGAEESVGVNWTVSKSSLVLFTVMSFVLFFYF